MTVVNEKRRKHFREVFEKEPIGNILNIQKLAMFGKTKIPHGTITAFLRELVREGLVHHEVSRPCAYSCQFYVAVWSRIK